MSSQDQQTTIGQLKAMVKEFCDERDWDRFHTVKDLAVGVSTEASELLALFRFRSEEETLAALAEDKTERVMIGDELADVLFFLLRFAQKYDFDLAGEFARKLRENEVNFPAPRSRGSNGKQ